ncbi:MAG: hypothetical protein KAU62_13720 [Candidatus Heimdallarchaeota archaeon]|nr:hypothetical protein [Candidatus Heimdallarchaeota archaeon]MCG3257150.1 hypothetical protein [Candidatus Heimdallarchaeota archaeon]MCK4612210.1 hypothetical protein [Candidatus Heimdallarchaeota archaeon]
MSKVLVSYQTLYGATREAASVIADTLEKDYGFQVDLYQLEENKITPDSSDYESIIIGSCIFHGKWGKSAEEFLRNDFTNKNVAVFVCAGFAGEERLHNQAHRVFLEEVLEKYPRLKPVSMKAFGGRVPRAKIPHIWYLQTTKKMPSFGYDTRNLEKVKEWAHELGSLFRKT